MTISADDNATLQKQYDALREQWLSQDDATSNIRNTLNKSIVWDSATAFDVLKNSYNNGWVEWQWIASTTPQVDVKPLNVPTPVIQRTDVPNSTTSDTTKPNVVATSVWSASTTPLTTGSSWIAEQTKLDQNEADRVKAIKDKQDSYILSQANYNTNKGYYTNFDSVNTQFNNVMKDREALLTSSPNGQITPEQAQQIAFKYWVSADSVLNPNKIFEQLSPTEEWKLKLWITAHDQTMSDAELNNKRQQEDLATSLNISKQNIASSIEDVKKQLDRNLQVMTAQWAWSWGLKSSGYQQWIQNVLEDGQATINKLEQMRTNVETANIKDVARLTEDYNTAVTRAKQSFDIQNSDLQHNMWLALNAASAQYGIDSKELSRALDDINTKYGANAADISAKFLQNMKTVNDITKQNIDNAKASHDYISSIADKRYNEYIYDKSGSLLGNTTFSNIASEVNSGKMTYDHAQNLKSLMLRSIGDTLSKNGTVSTDDQNTIEHLLSTNMTPMQIVAKMQELDKFKEKTPTTEKQLINNELYEKDPKTGDWKKVISSSEAPQTSTNPDWTKVTINSVGSNDLSSLYNGSNGPAFANNNPWNIQDTSFGWVAGWKGWFTKFNTVEDGVNALLSKLKYNQANGVDGVSNWSSYNGNMTLLQYFQKYAPSSDGNDPNAYARSVASMTWSNVNTPIKNVDTEAMAIAIMKHENVWVYNELIKRGIIGSEGINTPSPSVSSTTPGKEYTDSQKNLMDMFGWKTLTKAQEQDLKNSKLTVSDYADYSAEKKSSESNGSSNIDSIASRVANYSMSIPDLNALRKDPDKWQSIVNAALVKNPYFDEKNYQAWQKVLNSWTSWNNANTITAANKVVNHLNELVNVFDKLKNKDVWSLLPWVQNYAGNEIDTLAWKGKASNFEQVVSAVGNELAKVFKGVWSTSEKEIEAMKNSFNTSMTPTDFKNKIASALELMNGQMAPLQNKYEDTMGIKPNIFDKDTVEVLNQLKDKWYDVSFDYTNPENTNQNVNISWAGNSTKSSDNSNDLVNRLLDKYSPKQ